MVLKHHTAFRSETLDLDREVLSLAPGRIIELPDGITHYEMVGPPNGRTVVLVHGFSAPYYIWDPVFRALVDAEFRTLRYDLYGRGFSSRPKTVYDRELFYRQLSHLLSALDIHHSVDLIGFSMGGPIIVHFTDQSPRSVRKLVLIGPAGFSVRHPFSIKLLKLPIFGDFLMKWLGDKRLLAALKNDLFRPEKFPEYVEKYRDQMKIRGFKSALLSTLRYGPLGDLSEIYKRVGRQQSHPILLIWGTEDRIVPYQNNEKIRAAMPRSEFHAIPKAGHVVHYERPDAVNPLLLAFLRKG